MKILEFTKSNLSHFYLKSRIIAFNWHAVRDRDTYLTDIKGNKPLLYKQYAKAASIILVTCIAMLVLMKHSELSNNGTVKLTN